MYRFIETIKINNNRIINPEYHSERYLKTLKFFYPDASHSSLINTVQKELASLYKNPVSAHSGTSYKSSLKEMKARGNAGILQTNKLFKCRVVYSDHIETVDFIPYEIKKISSLKTVTCNQIDYSYKYSNRNDINRLYHLKENCDDVIIIKNNMVTDSSYANTVFYKNGKYYTPDTPLLNGTKRKELLNKNLIKERQIKVNEIQNFEYISLINAMIDLDEVIIKTENIY